MRTLKRGASMDVRLGVVQLKLLIAAIAIPNFVSAERFLSLALSGSKNTYQTISMRGRKERCFCASGCA